jgi:hypothetical protein
MSMINYSKDALMALGAVAALGYGWMNASSNNNEQVYLAKATVAPGDTMAGMIRNCDPKGELSDRVHMAQVAQSAQGGMLRVGEEYFVPVTESVANGNIPDNCYVVPNGGSYVTEKTNIESLISELYNNK